MPYHNLQTDFQAGVWTLTLNRPDKLNALTAALLDELTAAFQQAEQDETVRVVVLTGAGRGFCSGQDVAVAAAEGFGQAGFAFSTYLQTHYDPLILAMQRLPKPIIGVVNGVAAGAGMSLALACDLRIAAESAFFTQAFVKIGLIPDSGSTWVLPRLVGLGRALELMFSGRRVNAAEALQMGLVNQVVPDAALAEAAATLAQQYAQAPTQVLGYIKQAAYLGLNTGLEAALAQEAALQDAAGATADHQEGVLAFLQKRPPQFSGR